MMVSCASGASALTQAGYSLLPLPQQLRLSGREVQLNARGGLVLEKGIAANDVAVEALKEGLKQWHGVELGAAASGTPAIVLVLRDGAMVPELAQDQNLKSIIEQAYRIQLSANEIRISANAPVGLFYGVETFVQLIRHQNGRLYVPNGQITDWPDLELRCIYWDDAHHLEKLDALKRAIRQAAFFKINAFAIKLEGHFQYKSAPALVEPQALSAEQLQELTDYASRYHVQLIPYLDAPAHVAFILKHPEYASLRAFPDSNYEMCVENPDTLKLLFGMYQELLDANRGSKYFVLSTDEPYYVGMADHAQCNETTRLKELGSPGRVLAEFVTKAAGYLHDRGRQVIFWGEFPMKPSDVSALPTYLINGETGTPEFDRAFREHGMRQMVYTSTEGEEKLFPDYAVLPRAQRLHSPEDSQPRVQAGIDQISSPATRANADLMGTFVAGWADAGLHPDTFWLGYATISAAGWNPHATEAAQATRDFLNLFYGPSQTDMDRAYTLLAYQAQRWSDSWDTSQSKWRKPIWGNSNSIFHPRRPARDQSLPLPPVPESSDLSIQPGWSDANARRLELAEEGLRENDELLALLNQNLGRAEFNRHNVRVLVTVAQLCRQNLHMIREIGHIDQMLDEAHRLAAENRPEQAIAKLDEVLASVQTIRLERNRVLRSTTEVWYESWLPRVAEANGRRFVHELDDVKDHLPDRTLDMSYLVYRELILPMDRWTQQVRAARNAYAKAHHLRERTENLDWGSPN